MRGRNFVRPFVCRSAQRRGSPREVEQTKILPGTPRQFGFQVVQSYTPRVPKIIHENIADNSLRSLVVAASLTAASAQKRVRATNSGVPAVGLVQIIRAEDERRWDDSLKNLLSDTDAQVRRRAALAAGRIGDELAVPALIEQLQKDKDREVREMAAFGGRIESQKFGGSFMRSW